MIAALKDPILRKWPKFIKHEIDFAICDCRIYDNRIYYRNRLFILANDELKMQIVHVRGVGSFIATSDPLLTSISNLRKKKRKFKVHVQGVPYIVQGLTLEND
jgi:hypothetical protein